MGSYRNSALTPFMLFQRPMTLTLFSMAVFGLSNFTAAETDAVEMNPTPAQETETSVPDIEPAIAGPLNLSETLGDYLGYGLGINAPDIDYPQAFDDLKLHFVRLEFGPRWDLLEEKIPAGKTVEDYVAYLKRNYNGDFPERLAGAKRSHQFLRERGIQIIQIHFELPYHWRAEDGSNLFLSKHIEDLARFHTAHLAFLSKNGIHIDYIELCNEPDGDWNGHIPAEDYGHLLERCDALFEEHGFGKVKILGPGLTFLNLHNIQQPYFDAIEKVGPEHLDGWSTHVWDEAEFTHSNPEYVYGIWAPFLERIEKLDPERKKPVFVTEYASDIINFGEKEWTSPRDQVTNTVVNQWPHATRVIANSITNLNRGANGIVLYRFSDTHWHDTGWGMITLLTPPNFEPKPVYHALVNTLATLPRNSKVLAPTWYLHDDAITMSILYQSDSNRLDLIAVNSTETTATKTFPLSPEVADLSLDELKTYTETGISDKSELTIKDSTIEIKLPPFSIAKAVLKQQQKKEKIK